MIFKNCWKILGLSSFVFFCISEVNIKAIASEIEPKNLGKNYSSEEILLKQLQQQNSLVPPSLGQISSIYQLRDLSPENWAYEALRSLTERYGRIVGFPNSTYQGEQVIPNPVVKTYL